MSSILANIFQASGTPVCRCSENPAPHFHRDGTREALFHMPMTPPPCSFCGTDCPDHAADCPILARKP